MTLGTEVLVLPQRQPALVAKQISTLDTLSGGRVRLGVGVGWQESEYEALHEDFHTRGARMDEAIALLRTYWTEAEVTSRGPSIRPCSWPWSPSRHRDGDCPSGSAAIRGRLSSRRPLGDGWLASRVNDADDARRSIETIHRYAAEAGRAHPDIGLQSMVAPPPRDAEGKRFYTEADRVVARVAALKAMGFEWVALNATAIFQAGARSVDAMLDRLSALHDRIRAEVG